MLPEAVIRGFTFSVLVGGFCFGGSLFVLAQQETAPTFRTGTTLVEFTVVALDGRGNPVTDLRREELVLTDGGESADIAFFRYDGGPSPAHPIDDQALPPAFGGNAVQFAGEQRSTVVALVLDALNTAAPDQISARNQLLHYLNRLPPNTHAGFFRFGEGEPVRMLQGFTTDMRLLRTKLNEFRATTRRELITPGHSGSAIVGAECHIVSNGSASTPGPVPANPKQLGGAGVFVEVGGTRGSAEVGDARNATGIAFGMQEVNRQIREARLERTLSSLESLGSYLSGIPGRKAIVWVTSGMPLLLMGTGKNYEPRVRAAAQRLANSGVALYPVDAKGLCRQGDISKNEGTHGFHDAPPMVFASLDVLADVTGGRVIKNSNDPASALRLAADDQRGTYTVGFYAADLPGTDQWRPLTVSTTRKGAVLRHRQGYLLRSSQPQDFSPEAWKAIAYDSLESTTLALHATVQRQGTQLVVTLRVPVWMLYFQQLVGALAADLEIGLVESASRVPINVQRQSAVIRLKDETDRNAAPVVPLETTWKIDARTTSVRVVLRDRYTGRYGSLSVPLDR